MASVLNGLDSILSTAQMPAGIPVGTLAIGKAGAVTAALLAVSILATSAGVVGEGAPGHGEALARFLNVGNCPARIISLPLSTNLPINGCR